MDRYLGIIGLSGHSLRPIIANKDTHNRKQRYPIIGIFSRPMSGRLNGEMGHSYSRLWTGIGRSDWRRGAPDLLVILYHRLTRNEIAHAQICDNRPLVGIEPATFILYAESFPARYRRG